MLSQLWPALRINIFLTILLGVAYPLAVTGISQLVFPHQANGSLITKGRSGDRLGTDRAELHQARILPAAPVRRR